MALKTKTNLSFKTTKRVPLGKPAVKETVRAGKAKAKRSVKAAPVTAPPAPVARPVREAKAAPVVAQATRALPPSRVISVLSPLLERVSVGEFRGRKPRPDVMLTATELQALTQCVDQVRAAMGTNVKPTASPVVAKRTKRSA